jgi:hypothetical protein
MARALTSSPRSWKRTSAPSSGTAVGMTKPTKRARLGQFLAEARPGRITELEYRQLRERLAPVSDSYLRHLLRDCGLPLDPVLEGIRQRSFEELERTLLAVGAAYAEAVETGDRERAAACRRAVITGKEHARLAARHPAASEEARARKVEMASWMLVWLENPAIFPTWLGLRKKAGIARTLGERLG